MPVSTLLRVADVSKTYKGQPCPSLAHVTFDVEQGEFLGIMGASGSGKTTLLNVLSTIDSPTGGQRQCVTAAGAMVRRPPLIFADEPTGALDSGSAAGQLAVLTEAEHTLGIAMGAFMRRYFL